MREAELTFWYFTSPNSAGRFWPSSWFSRGFGSNVSRCDGPPAMYKKMNDLAGWWSGYLRRLGRQRIEAGRARLRLRQHRRKRQRPRAAEAIGQKFAAVARISNVSGHSSP